MGRGQAGGAAGGGVILRERGRRRGAGGVGVCGHRLGLRADGHRMHTKLGCGFVAGVN